MTRPPAGGALARALPALALLLALHAAVVRAQPALDAVRKAEAQLLVDPEASRRHAERALAELAAAPDPDLEIRARLMLCDYHSERDLAAARRELAAARELLPQAKQPALAAALHGCDGELHETTGDNLRAMALYEQAVDIAERHGDAERLATALHRRGYLRGVQGEYGHGLADLKRALTLAERIENPSVARIALNGIAILYNRMGDSTQAKHFYQRTLRSQEQGGARREQAVTLYNLGRADERLGNWDAAAASFARALALAQELAYPRGQAHALRGLASVANARGDGAQALTLLADAEALQRQTPDARLRGQIQLQRGIALALLKRPSEALAPLHEALQVFDGAESLAELVATHQAITRTLAALGDWPGAYRQSMSWREHAERLAQRQIDQRFASLKVEFDSAAKDQENALLLREKATAERLLAEQRRANTLQAAVIALAALLALTLAWQVQRQRRARLQMHRLAHTDELTGLPNRRDALAKLQALLQHGGGCALLIADLDHFKRINDRHGHPAGDEVLRRVGHALAESLREPASLGRLGGEEFVIVLPGSDAEAARHAAERVRERIRALDPATLPGGGPLSVSLGVAVSQPGDDVGSLLRRADEALYEAKQAGRDRVALRLA